MRRTWEKGLQGHETYEVAGRDARLRSPVLKGKAEGLLANWILTAPNNPLRVDPEL